MRKAIISFLCALSPVFAFADTKPVVDFAATMFIGIQGEKCASEQDIDVGFCTDMQRMAEYIEEAELASRIGENIRRVRAAQLAEYRRQAEAERRRRLAVGRRVCNTWANGQNGWCGYITQNIGESIRVENLDVFCGDGGFLGICTNLQGDDDPCLGHMTLYVDSTYRNPKEMIVPGYCVN